MIIRNCQPSDAAALQAIYAPYVEQTSITMEWTAPTTEEMRQRIESISAGMPYLVAEDAEGIVGYAYASPYKTRRGLAHSVETSIYIARHAHGRGIGRLLYEALEQRLAALGKTNLYASITHTSEPDPHLTDASIRFHERMGYEKVAQMHRCCTKFGRFYDLVWMEKIIKANINQP